MYMPWHNNWKCQWKEGSICQLHYEGLYVLHVYVNEKVSDDMSMVIMEY